MNTGFVMSPRATVKFLSLTCLFPGPEQSVKLAASQPTKKAYLPYFPMPNSHLKCQSSQQSSQQNSLFSGTPIYKAVNMDVLQASQIWSPCTSWEIAFQAVQTPLNSSDYFSDYVNPNILEFLETWGMITDIYYLSCVIQEQSWLHTNKLPPVWLLFPIHWLMLISVLLAHSQKFFPHGMCQYFTF